MYGISERIASLLDRSGVSPVQFARAYGDQNGNTAMLRPRGAVRLSTLEKLAQTFTSLGVNVIAVGYTAPDGSTIELPNVPETEPGAAFENYRAVLKELLVEQFDFPERGAVHRYAQDLADRSMQTSETMDDLLEPGDVHQHVRRVMSAERVLQPHFTTIRRYLEPYGVQVAPLVEFERIQ